MTRETATISKRTESGHKRRLVEDGRDILEHDGPEALTLRAVGKAAGVSHMAPYRHFDDKDDLLAAIAETGFADLAKTMQRAAESPEGPRAVGHAYIDFARRRPALYRLMFGPVLPDRTRYPGLADAGQAAFARCVETADATGAPASEARAIALWSLVHGLASLLIDGRVAIDGDEDDMIDAVLAVSRPV